MTPWHAACSRCQCDSRRERSSFCTRCLREMAAMAFEEEQESQLDRLRRALVVARGGFLSLSRATEFSQQLAPLHIQLIDEATAGLMPPR